MDKDYRTPMSFPIIKNAPFITTDQMIEVDRLMMHEYGITLIQMMENAGRCFAILARDRFLGPNLKDKKILVMAGPGGNGGGAMVAACRLAGWGADVSITLSHPVERITNVPMHQLAILQHMHVPIVSYEEAIVAPYDLILDGLLGYSLKGAPRGLSAQLISMANGSDTPILALDVPSGLDATSGKPHTPTIEAMATLTLALPKIGLTGKTVQSLIGELYCGDISVPLALYAQQSLDLKVPNIFAQGDIIRIA